MSKQMRSELEVNVNLPKDISNVAAALEILGKFGTQNLVRSLDTLSDPYFDQMRLENPLNGFALVINMVRIEANPGIPWMNVIEHLVSSRQTAASFDQVSFGTQSQQLETAAVQ